MDAKAWSIYGAERSQPVATGGKWDCPENGSNKPKPLPWVATSCRAPKMVRRGSTVRVRQRALQKPRKTRLLLSGALARFTARGRYGALYGAFRSRSVSVRREKRPHCDQKVLSAATLLADRRSVTPEVGGSSPVAPVENVLQIKVFCCQSWRRRPLVSHRPPALIPRAHGVVAVGVRPPLQRGVIDRCLGTHLGLPCSRRRTRCRARSLALDGTQLESRERWSATQR
jgi:hypothetical protein